MTQNKTHSPKKRSTGARIALIVTGAITSLLAVGLIGLGAFALWGENQKDEEGYLNTGSHRFTASTHALATENLEMDLDGVSGLVSSPDLGQVRLQVAPESGDPVFAGIARTADVTSYLDGVAHTEVTDLDYEPFEADYSPQRGERKPAPPAGERIWAASAEGAGSQTLNWKVRDGDWSVVVMNADGSRGVQADVSAGAKVPYLTSIGWGVLGGGTALLLAALVLVVFGVRAPRQRRGGQQGTVIPASAS
jgi:hypothetical protein